MGGSRLEAVEMDLPSEQSCSRIPPNPRSSCRSARLLCLARSCEIPFGHRRDRAAAVVQDISGRDPTRFRVGSLIIPCIVRLHPFPLSLCPSFIRLAFSLCYLYLPTYLLVRNVNRSSSKKLCGLLIFTAHLPQYGQRPRTWAMAVRFAFYSCTSHSSTSATRIVFQLFQHHLKQRRHDRMRREAAQRTGMQIRARRLLRRWNEVVCVCWLAWIEGQTLDSHFPQVQSRHHETNQNHTALLFWSLSLMSRVMHSWRTEAVMERKRRNERLSSILRGWQQVTAHWKVSSSL